MNGEIAFGRVPCSCENQHAACQLIAVTGGPGAGKTAVLAVARQLLCQHVIVLPEAATIVFKGGFWRRESPVGARAAQRAIYCVQRQLEDIVIKDHLAAVGLCDRGTVDGAVYWPSEGVSYWEAMGVSREAEMARYAAVVHLRTPEAHNGYDLSNPYRIESARRAAELDEAILQAWQSHPRRVVVAAAADFEVKVKHALDAIGALLPGCCRGLARRPHV